MILSIINIVLSGIFTFVWIILKLRTIIKINEIEYWIIKSLSNKEKIPFNDKIFKIIIFQSILR